MRSTMFNDLLLATARVMVRPGNERFRVTYGAALKKMDAALCSIKYDDLITLNFYEREDRMVWMEDHAVRAPPTSDIMAKIYKDTSSQKLKAAIIVARLRHGI